MCRTRWAARHTAYTHFYQAHTFITAALENSVYGANKEKCGDSYQDEAWDSKRKTDAGSILSYLTSFEFIVTFLVMYEFLSHLAGITVKLQGRSVDIISEYHEVNRVSLLQCSTISLDHQFYFFTFPE